MMNIKSFLLQLKTSPHSIHFDDVIGLIEHHYIYKPGIFRNGSIVNKAGENEGSCKLFFFAKCQQLSMQETLNCFGHYYRQDVLLDPDGTSHQNIRQFMQTGWSGISFDSDVLTEKL